MKVEIDKEVLFKLVVSHSQLAQAEYERNESFNNEHPAYIAEQGVINEFEGSTLMMELLQSMQLSY